MTATLQLNLSQHLNADELQVLTAESLDRQQPIERVLYDAAKELIMRRRAARKDAKNAA
jgi:hypothetical protein